MGYRNEVGIKCEHKAFEDLMEACKQSNFMPDEVIEDGEYKILHWDWTKWGSWNGTGVIESCMENLNATHEVDEDDGLGYSFIRIGESDDDIETFCNSTDMEFYIVRKIDLPEPLSEKEKKKQKIKNLIEDIKDGAEKTAEQVAEILDEIF